MHIETRASARVFAFAVLNKTFTDVDQTFADVVKPSLNFILDSSLQTNDPTSFDLVLERTMPQRALSIGLLVAATLAGAWLPLRSAHAADLDYSFGDAPPPIPQTKVEFGTGWYVRGDIAATRSEQAMPSAVSFNTTNPAVIPVSPGLGFSTSNDVGYTASIGGGYQFNRWFRTDLLFDFHEPIRSTYTGGGLTCPGGFTAAGALMQEGCSPHYSGALKSYDVLFNGYLDLGTWYSVTPYVGAGVGMAFGHYTSSVQFTQSDGTPYNVYPTDPTTGAT